MGIFFGYEGSGVEGGDIKQNNNMTTRGCQWITVTPAHSFKRCSAWTVYKSTGECLVVETQHWHGVTELRRWLWRICYGYASKRAGWRRRGRRVWGLCVPRTSDLISLSGRLSVGTKRSEAVKITGRSVSWKKLECAAAEVSTSPSGHRHFGTTLSNRSRKVGHFLLTAAHHGAAVIYRNVLRLQISIGCKKIDSERYFWMYFPSFLCYVRCYVKCWCTIKKFCLSIGRIRPVFSSELIK